MSYQLYRNTSLGQTLQDSLYDLVQYGQIPSHLASEILLHFDKAINDALSNRVKSRVMFHSDKLSTYRFCDNVWTFLLKDVEFKEQQRTICKVDKVKIVACDAKAAFVQSADRNRASNAASGEKEADKKS